MGKNYKLIWDKVYKKYRPSDLPWTGIRFPSKLNSQLNKLDKNEPLLIPGCGAGDTIKILNKMGFKNIIGTDISEAAINSAKRRFPKFKFKNIATQNLSCEGYNNVNIFDWVNIHQISPKNIRHYLLSLQSICSTLILAYIFEPELGKSRPSYITGDRCYNYNPKDIINILNNLALKEQFRFEFKINPKFGEKTHKAVALVFEK